MPEQPIVVFADGSSKGNPGPGGWGALVVTPAGQVTELGGGATHTTNNKMELSAAIEALRHLRGTGGAVAVYTDSTYVIRGITQWINGWRRRGWKTATGTEVLNREYWEELSGLIRARGAAGRVSWHHVPGHAGIPGNERVDEIADAFATQQRPALYRGSLAHYTVPVLDIPEPSPRSARPAPHTSSGGGRTPHAPYSYLSVVGGQPMRHATWAECERRVKGVSGARFKKAMSRADEEEILRGWGFSPEDV
jgi:ribonuclease HI